ncbi:RHS repeat-associated core domain-containing protein [Ahniella affigens]|uniref:RHS repeat-associated core domain-containing protein n=1 Tax=Ahniella affigens TaxID=2021234 RepID=UPI00197F4C62|nr:RHS repeat-associated core domain-containing protein [Ahniella affigens]
MVSRTFYRFDARDRLIKAEPEAPNLTNIPTVEFVYDAEDRKIARIETPWLNGNPVQANAQATVSLYDGQTLLHEAKPGSGGTSNSQGLIITDTYRNSAKLDRHVSFGPNGTDTPTIRFYQLDALGTPLILTDASGQAIVSNTVDAWGNTIQQTAQGQSTAPINSGNQSQDPNQTGQAALLKNDNQTIGFTGYQKDEDLGLYYAGARFYDPLIGGFGAMDPWTGDTGRPITLNKYLYANGNPVVFVDPDGRKGCDSVACTLLQSRNQLSDPSEIKQVDALIERNMLENAGKADAIQHFATESFTATLELGAEVHSAQVKYQTLGLVDTGGDAKLEDRSYAMHRFLANHPIDAIGENIGRRMAQASIAQAEGDYRTATRIRMGVELDVVSGATGAASLIRGGAVGIARITAAATEEVGSMASSLRSIGAVENEMMPPYMPKSGDFPEVGTSAKLSGTGDSQSGLAATVVEPTSSPDGGDYVYVYRGTNRGTEIQVFDETGHLMSDAAIRSLLENGGDIDDAYATAQALHQQWIEAMGSDRAYIEAHSSKGTELQREYGIPRTLMSVTTDPQVAATYAKDGNVFGGLVPRSELLKQTLEGAGESEYVIIGGTNRLSRVKLPGQL